MSPAFEVLDWDDTPRYYDMVFDEDTNKEADFLEGLARRHGVRGRRRVLAWSPTRT